MIDLKIYVHVRGLVGHRFCVERGPANQTWYDGGRGVGIQNAQIDGGLLASAAQSLATMALNIAVMSASAVRKKAAILRPDCLLSLTLVTHTPHSPPVHSQFDTGCHCISLFLERAAAGPTVLHRRRSPTDIVRQPVGTGSGQIRRSIAPNSRRVRWLSASKSQ